ncbi:uncharacterized protein LOC129773819 [Toxorhynchites rutilus septentrionalis]|uniref:uncharacterized protein LOC129773819 n=1 Tax=Toxorhynchites rutilus septentrionalis TaxID=329112 RepID=UPI002478E0C7|nr:uncharacterized protein LOC129773819 [Toxorhynchites rutilus septentrionalis]
MIHPGHIEVQANPDLLPGPFRVVTAIATTETMAPYCNAHVLASSAAVNGTSTSVLLSTVVLIIVDAYGQEHFARALLDTGSQPNAISERLCQQLHLTRTTVNVPISGVDGSLTKAPVTSDTPAVSYNTANWKIPKSVSLADPEFNVSRRIDIIIGAGHFYTLLRDGRIKLFHNLPILVETVFGWIVAGRMESNDLGEKVACHVAQIPSIDDQLERFWNLEDVSGTNYSVDEQQCEDFYRRTVSRDNSGRYIVRMPRHPQFEQMFGSSKETTLQRFRRLERMLESKPELKPQYHDFIREYIALGHMTEVPDGDVDRPDACYLPHHPVVKESSSTTKVRVVFDGSAKTSSGHSLNEALLVGPVVQDELITIVLRFRQFPIALVADIEKMYRQVSLHLDDRPLQRIFWRFNSIEPIKAYELSTITYGLAPSSFLATRTLQQVVEDEGSNFPEASRVVKKDVYVDDLISGENTVERTIQLQRDLMELLQRGGFRLRKWVSNFLEVLSAIPGELQGTRSPMQFDPEETIKTLGICWEPETDTLCFNVSINPKNSVPTKREILSTIAQLYDPLGIVSPVIVQAKILMQQLWLLCLGWDDEITPDLHQYHTFADASKDAYGACLYIRSEDANGNVKVNLLTSKSKVTPLKPISIPRLELRAALLASRLFEKVVPLRIIFGLIPR